MTDKQWYTIAYALRHGWLWILAGVLVLVMVSLGFGYVQSTTDQGHPLAWPVPNATLTLGLGCPPNTPLQSPWGSCWDDVARHAAAEWNKAGSRFQFQVQQGSSRAQVSCTSAQVDEVNVVVWSATICGQSWGDAVAVTTGWYSGNGDFGDKDVLFNSHQSWSAYTGPPRFPGGEPVYELHRVAMHEFGHVLGLDHPNDHGQTVRAIMHSSNMNGTIERLQADDIAGVRAIYGTTRSAAPKGTLGNPGHRTFASGIGVISGWVCDAQQVEVQIGLQRIRMAYGTDRPDTQSVCGDTNNGFVTLVNYNALGAGVHTARLVVDGRQVGSAHEFIVTTFGTEFLRGAEAAYVLDDFPRPGVNPVIIWSQGRQNFVISACETAAGELVRCDTAP